MRKMPAHIVLPNGMWRFVKRGKSGKRAKRSRGGTMARRKRGFSRRRGGLGGLLSGRGKVGAMIGMGLIGSVIGGYVGGIIADKIMPGNTMIKLAASFIAGGPIGAGAVYLAPNLPNSVLGGISGLGSSSNGAVM